MAKKKKQAKGAARQPRNTPPKQPAPPPSRLAVHRPLYERILFALSLLGVLVTVHLTVWYGAGAPVSDDPVCGAGFDCQAVLASDPAPLGIPSSVWGLLFYLGVAGVCAGIVYVADEKRLLLKKIRLGMVGIGFLYSLFLTIYQFFVLSDRCLLCLISASVVTAMAVVLGLYVFKPAPQAGSSRRATPALAGEYRLYGILAVLLIVLVGADYGFYRDQAPPETATTTRSGEMPVAVERSVDVNQCRYDPDRPYFSNMNSLVTDYDPIAGNPDAPITMMEFLDPNCPHCMTLHPTMKAVLAKYPDHVRIVYKPVALVGSPTHSLDEVRALLLAEDMGQFDGMLELQFVNQTPSTGLSVDKLSGFAGDLGLDEDVFEAELTNDTFNREAMRNRQIYNGLGLRGVPGVILEGRLVHSGSRSVGCFSHFIEQQLAAKGIDLEAETPATETDSSAVEIETPIG